MTGSTRTHAGEDSLGSVRRSLRILFMTHYFHPEVGAAQTRILHQARALSELGHAVTVLTGFPNYPDGVIPSEYRGRITSVEHMHGLRIVRTAVYPAPNRGFGRRLLNHTSFASSSLLSSIRTGPADVVVVETPPLFAAGAGVALARLKRAPMVLHVADLWPDAAIEFGALSNPLAIAAARTLERFSYARAARIVVTTPGHRRALLKRGRPPEQVVVVPHGVDLDQFPIDRGSGPVPRRVVYCGTIGMGHSVGTLVEAAARLEQESAGFEFMIAGDGPERAFLESEARGRGLRSVTFLGRVPRRDLAPLLASAQLTVITQRDAPLLRDALSSKLLEYMAAARPVVASVNGWTGELVNGARAGAVCPPERPDLLARAIATMADDSAAAARMGQRGRQYVERFLTRASVAERLEQALQEAVQRRTPGSRPGSEHRRRAKRGSRAPGAAR